MCRSAKTINLGPVVCQISLPVPIRETDGWGKNCLKCQSPQYLPTFIGFHEHGSIPVLLIFFFFTPRKALTLHCCALSRLTHETPSQPQIQIMPSKTKMFGQALLLHVCFFGMREVTPTRCQCSTTAELLTLLH